LGREGDGRWRDRGFLRVRESRAGREEKANNQNAASSVHGELSFYDLTQAISGVRRDSGFLHA